MAQMFRLLIDFVDSANVIISVDSGSGKGVQLESISNSKEKPVATIDGRF